MLHKSAEISLTISLLCRVTRIQIFVTWGASFYLWVQSVQPPIWSLNPWVQCIYLWNVLYTRWYHIHPLVQCICMQERSDHSLRQSLYPLMRCISMQECSLHVLRQSLYPLVQCICMQEDYTMAIYNDYTLGAMYLHARLSIHSWDNDYTLW